MLRRLFNSVRLAYQYLQLPPAAKAELRKDKSGLAELDPGIDRVVEEGIAWLGRAQDKSQTQDGGVARFYSLITGWSSSYPETTGYIIPTLLTYSKKQEDESLRQRAKRMLDWLVSIQLPEGGFQGGLIDSKPVVQVTFNTGSVLLGLASGAKEFGDKYREAMIRTAEWLKNTQDADGCWRNHPSPFAQPGEKVQDTHVAWGLFEADRVQPGKGYAEAALRNISWALKHQRPNGWFEKCSTADGPVTLSHTLGFVLHGILEAYDFTHEKALLKAAIKTADGLLNVIHLSDGFLPGLIDSNWNADSDWSCLVGNVQISYCWLMLYRYTADTKYRDAAVAVNHYVRRSVNINGPVETRGAVKGSFPVNGAYGPYRFLSGKFLIDANLLEQIIREKE